MLDGLIQSLASAFRTYPTQERRRSVRLPCRYAVYCLGRKKAIEAMVADIGPGGLRLELVQKLSKGQKFDLVYRGVPGGKLTRLPFRKLQEVKNKVSCKVLWCMKLTDSYEAGLVFQPSSGVLDDTWIKPVLDKMGYEKGAFDQKRVLIRAKAHLNADLKIDGESVRGLMVNVGLGGALFQSSKHLGAGHDVELLVNSHPKLSNLRIKGKILSHSFDVVSNSGMHNLQFEGLDDQTLKLLTSYVTHLLKTEGST